MNTNSNAAPAPDSNPSPATPELQLVPPPAPKRHPGALNKAELVQVERLEVLIPLARAADAAGPLGERGITPQFLTDAEGRINTVRSASTTAVNCTVLGKAATQGSDTARDKLMESLRTFQQAARLKYEQSDPVQLERYLIGERIDQSRPILTQSGQTIINNTNQDRPPSIDTSMIVAATGKLTTYENTPTPQALEKAAAKQARADRNALIAQIIDDRQRIQMAAESAWPHTNRANEGMRLQFRLPANRPYVA